jgi:hypothetical protein
MNHDAGSKWKLSEVTITLGQLVGICGTIGGAIMVLGLIASLRFVDWPTFYQHKTDNDKCAATIEQDHKTVEVLADEIDAWQRRMAKKYGENK